MFFEILAKKQWELTGLDVPVGLKLTVDEVAVDLQLKTPTIAGDEDQGLYLVFVSGQDFFRRTDGTREVFSNSAVGEGDVYHGLLLEDRG